MIFDRIKKMSNVLMKKIDKMEIEPNKCLKVRAVTSNCSACMDVCPKNSINITLDSIELDETCLACGLCTAVCPTNAIKWNHPPLMQLLNQIFRISEKENDVYIACSSSFKKNQKSNVVEVPCLGIIPEEFWISIGLNAPTLRIIHETNFCSGCRLSKGEEMFLEQLKKAENLLNKTIPVCSSIKEEDSHDTALIDHNRRIFITAFLEEVKETNTIAVKEALEMEKTLSPFEKFDRYYQQHNEIDEVVEEMIEVKQAVIDRLVNDTVIYTDKRTILFEEFKKYPELQEEMFFSIPEIEESCTRCGACSFLCPTDALHMDEDRMILSTNKCVSCHLCEEICFEKHIKMVSKKGTIFNEKYIYLLKNKVSL